MHCNGWEPTLRWINWEIHPLRSESEAKASPQRAHSQYACMWHVLCVAWVLPVAFVWHVCLSNSIWNQQLKLVLQRASCRMKAYYHRSPHHPPCHEKNLYLRDHITRRWCIFDWDWRGHEKVRKQVINVLHKELDKGKVQKKKRKRKTNKC